MSASTRLLSASPWTGGPSDLAADFGAIEALTPQHIHAARLRVAFWRGDRVADLLAMLGLVDA